MESRPAPLRSRRVCRFCLTESEPLNFIYERDHSKPFQVPLTLQIMSCVAIEVIQELLSLTFFFVRTNFDCISRCFVFGYSWFFGSLSNV